MKSYIDMKRIYKYAAVLLFVFALAMATGIPAAHAGEYWQQVFSRMSGTAGETLAIGDIVCIDNTLGTVWKADADAETRRPAIGAIGKGGAAGATVEIVLHGILAGQTELSEGYRLYLSTTAGAVTTTAQTNEQLIGIVLPHAPGDTGPSTSSRYLIQPVLPVSDGAHY